MTAFKIGLYSFTVILLSGICTSQITAASFVGENNSIIFRRISNHDESTNQSINAETELSSFSDDPCYNIGLCKKQNKSATKTCYCDKLCVYYRDCCYDAILETNTNITNFPQYNNLDCVNYKDEHKNYEGFWMVTKCANGYTNQFIISQCKSRLFLLNKVPVFDENGIAFVNAYCAMCNNIEKYIMSSMNYDLSWCKSDKHSINQSDFTSVSRTTCGMKKDKLVPPLGLRFRQCLTLQMINNNDNPICQRYMTPLAAYVDNEFHILKNFFCVNENSVDLSKPNKCIEFEDFGQNYDLYPLFVIFRFSPPKIKSDASQCLATEIFNSTTGICAEKNCENSTKLPDGLCYSGPFYSKTYFYIYYSFESNKILKDDDFKVLSVFHHFSFETSKYSTNRYVFNTEKRNTSTSGTQGYSTVRTFISSTQGIKPEELETIKSILLSTNFTYIQKNSKEEDETVISMIAVSKNETPDHMLLETKKSHIFSTRGYETKYLSLISLEKYKKSKFCDDISINITLMNYTQYTNISNEEKVVTLEISGNYLIVDSWKCKKYLELRYTDDVGEIPIKKPLNIESILTYSCMGLSCISLSFSIVIHRILSFSDTIPGSNTFNLMVNMLIAHVLFMVGIGANDFQVLCKCLGVAIHYFWLTTFSFTTIGIVHITHTFSKLSTQPNTFKSTKADSNRKLTLVGYVIALCIVLPSLIVDVVDSIPFSVGYGGNICFPTDYPATLIFVSGPIVIFISINLICLVISICKIGKETTKCKAIEKGYFSYFFVYIRLICLSGVLWLFGIFAALFQNQILNFILTVFVGLQGVFLTIATTCMPRVFKLLKERYNSKSAKTST